MVSLPPWRPRARLPRSSRGSIARSVCTCKALRSGTGCWPSDLRPPAAARPRAPLKTFARSSSSGARSARNSTSSRSDGVARTQGDIMARNVYLVGSVPMANAAEGFETVSAALGARIKWLPDGETGARGDWITWLEPIFSENPALQKSGEFFRVHASGTGRERYALRPGFRAEDVRFDNLFYADIAKLAYADFKRLKDAGKIAAGTKFQVDLVPAHSVIWLFLVDALHAPLDPLYNDALKREIDKVAAVVPHAELAIQFDVASAVFARLERNEASRYGRSEAERQGGGR